MMNIKGTSILLLSSLVGTSVQQSLDVIGFGSGSEILTIANQNPLNHTSVTFPGFNFDADPSSTANATSDQQWTWNAGLSIVNKDTNETNYPISSASNSTSNLIDVAYTLDFPGGQLPAQNNTNWTICANEVEVDWTSAVLKRASSDPGDCSTVLGSSCLARFRQGWQNPSDTTSIGCPMGPDFDDYPECKGITTNGHVYASAPVMSFLSDPNNENSTRVGLKSGQIFAYQTRGAFNASRALAEYNNAASSLRMVVLTFSPSKNFSSAHAGSGLNVGEVRTFCTILNKNAPRSNDASSGLTVHYHSVGVLATFWALLLVWGGL